MIKISPSIICANYLNLQKEIDDIAINFNVSSIHVDIMDGIFVNQITIGEKFVETIQKYSNLPLDIHLMTINPINQIEKYIKMNVNSIIFHYEAINETNDILKMEKIQYINYIIKKSGIKCGIAIDYNTDIINVLQYIKYCDIILVMTVKAGFAGQKFELNAINKIKILQNFLKEQNINKLIYIDGGINDNIIENIQNQSLSVDTFIMGSAFFKNKN